MTDEERAWEIAGEWTHCSADFRALKSRVAATLAEVRADASAKLEAEVNRLTFESDKYRIACEIQDAEIARLRVTLSKLYLSAHRYWDGDDEDGAELINAFKITRAALRETEKSE